MIAVHVVPHTHWDREWYHPAARFQLRLAHLVDEVIAALRGSPDLPSFLLDGQGVVLDDYAALRPERVDELRALLAQGRVEAGPWYVLPDELLVSAEALVRNLIQGGKVVRRSGGKPLAVGYAPDAFGHSAALPTILAGFGIEVAVVWRGFGGEPGQEGDLFRWRGPDGAEVVTVHLPRGGYEYGASLPMDPAAASQRWAALHEMLAPRARSPHWLVLNGADHHALQPDLPRAVEALQAAADSAAGPMAPAGRIRIRLGSLEGYADAVRGWARAHGGDLPVVTGELRGGRAHAWLLQGTHGSRLHLKQENAACQRALERLAEPLVAVASFAAPGEMRSGDALRADLNEAWRTLLENHPHDSICGTSADEVHREMATRFARCRAMASEIVNRAADAAVGHDAAGARQAGRGTWSPALLVFNPAPRRRSAVVEAEVALFRADVRVGQAWMRARRRAEAPARGGPLVLRARDGSQLPHQELERWTGTDLVESPNHYPDCDIAEWRRVVVAVEDLLPFGIAVLGVEESARPRADRPPRPPSRVAASDLGLENEHVSVRVEPGGTISLTDKATGLTARGLGALEDQRDQGDSYTSSLRGRPAAMPDEVAGRAVHAGPLRGELEIVRRYRAARLEATTRVVLDGGARHVVLIVSGVNRREAHRLRVAFPLGERPRRVVADGQFGPLERPLSRRPLGLRRGELEAAAPTAPMQRYVTVAGARRAVSVVSDGLPQYEVRPDGTVLVTVLRGFGELSRADLPERPGHAGWPTRTPEAQCLGPFCGRLAVLLHEPVAAEGPGVIEAAAEAFLAPPVALMRRALTVRPGEPRGPELRGEGLVFSAMKPAATGRGVVLRCYNARTVAVRGAWLVPWTVRSAMRCRLDETPLEQLGAEGGEIAFDAPPRAVVTVLIR